jgi:hypothetical protein
MTCPDCDHAKQHPNTGRYTAGCKGCCARALAKSHQFHDSHRAGTITPDYRRMLAQFFPDVPTADAHRLVKEWK